MVMWMVFKRERKELFWPLTLTQSFLLQKACNFITVNGIASGFVSLKGWSCWALLQEVGTPGSDTSRAPCQLCVRSPVLFSCLSTKESWWKMHEKMANFQRDKRNSFQIRDTISGKRQKTRLFWEASGDWIAMLLADWRCTFQRRSWPAWGNSYT